MASGPLTAKILQEQMAAIREKIEAKTIMAPRYFDDHMLDALKYGGLAPIDRPVFFDAGHSLSIGAMNMAQAAMAPSQKFTDSNMNTMLSTRMGWNVNAPATSFRKSSAHKLSDEQAVVFVIVGEKALVIHDDLNLFPSDALITQLRLLEN